MADITNSLDAAMCLPGAIAVGLVDADSGRCIAGFGIERLDLDAAADGNTHVLRTQQETLRKMDMEDAVEEILVTAESQVHIIRPVRLRRGGSGEESAGDLFLYLALDRERTNPGLTRFRLAEIAAEIAQELVL